MRASAQLYVAKSLLYGTTTLIDHHESPNLIEGSLDIIAEVCQELGMRAMLCYGITERKFGRAEAKRGLEECRRFNDSLVEAGDLCRELDVPLQLVPRRGGPAPGQI